MRFKMDFKHPLFEQDVAVAEVRLHWWGDALAQAIATLEWQLYVEGLA